MKGDLHGVIKGVSERRVIAILSPCTSSRRLSPPQNTTTISKKNRNVVQDQTLLPTRGPVI